MGAAGDSIATAQPAAVFAVCSPTAPPNSLDHLRACLVADAYARFRRAGGSEVRFVLAFPDPERREAIEGRARRLGCSCDWDRSFLAGDPEQSRRSQRLFLALLEKNLAYRQNGRWLLRTSAYAEESAAGLDALPEWREELIEAQRAMLGGSEGIEIDALILGGGVLPAFTPHRDAIGSAAFVAVSPAHPEIGALTEQPDVAARLEWAWEANWWRDEATKRAPAVSTGLHASVPGASTLLPLVISPRVDERFGPTAVLGIPELDDGDREIAETLEKPAATALKLGKLNAKPRPGVRYRIEDTVVAVPEGDGPPVPAVDCPQCGLVPLPEERLAPQNGDGGADECECPRCHGSARPDPAAILPRFDQLWMWMSAGDDDAERPLPIDRLVGEPGDDRLLLEQRTMAKMLEDAGKLPPLEGREHFAGAILPGRIRLGDDGAAELADSEPADVVRLALFVAASPQRSFAWNEEPVRYSRRILAELREYAEPRLRDWPAPEDGIEGSTKLRRSLAKWCRIAADKVNTSLSRLETQRATHNALLLFERIKDFEARAAGPEGELDVADREAVVAALDVLLGLLTPFVPRLGGELRAVANRESLAEVS